MLQNALRNVCQGAAVLFWLMTLVACQSDNRSSQPLSISYSPPIQVQTLGVENLLSFDVYVQGDKVHALFAASQPGSKTPYLAYVSSDDGGQHWQTPQSLSALLTQGLESKIGNDVQIAAHGQQLLAIWQVTGEIPGMGPLVSAVSQDGGAHWQMAAPPATPEFDQSHADLLADSQGRFHLVWLDDREENGYQGLRYARSDDGGQHWLQQQTLDDSTCSCCWNRLSVDHQDRISVLFRDGAPRDMALMNSADHGTGWQRAAPMSDFNWQFDGCPHNGGGLATDGEALFATIWTGLESRAGLYFVYSPDQGKSWTAPLTLSAPDSNAFHSDLAALDGERVVAIWDARNAQGSAVWFSESYDHGQHWQAARRLSSPEKSASFPRLIRTQTGLLALWMEQMTGEPKRWMSAVLR